MTPCTTCYLVKKKTVHHSTGRAGCPCTLKERVIKFTATGKAAAPVAMPKAAAPKAAILPKFIPASKAGDDKKDNGGWSSAHLPPTR